jgi:hypothetical protein
MGAGIAVAGGIAAWALSRHAGTSVARDTEVHSALPGEASGPGDLAVAWWPQDLSLEQHGTDATLRFQSTIANLGGTSVAIRPGDRLDYTVRRDDRDGTFGAIVGRGSVPLTRADVEPFPVSEGAEIGHSIQSFGTRLAPITSLEPQTAANIGAQHAGQAIQLHDVTKGTYTLSQQIVHADGSADPREFNDVRLTELFLDGTGGMVHASSRYAGGIRPNAG